jgi:thiol-disulfide isomerase/thioredoxin
MKSKILCIVFIFSYTISHSQTPLNLAISLPKNINKENLYIYLNNGIKDRDIPVNNDVLYISDTLFRKYASLYVNYHPKDNISSFLKGFFISGTENRINIRFDTVAQLFTFKLTKNVVDMDSVGRISLLQFTKAESDSFAAFNNAFDGPVPTTPENFQKVQFLLAKLDAKTLLFISKNPDLYLSLVTFKDGILSQYSPMPGRISIDSLWNFYLKYLSKKYANTYEDKYIRDQFYFKTLSAGKIAPEFIQEDVNDKTIDIRKIKSRYVLINFWASWCGPCIKEIPFLNSIRKKYPSDFLEFVYVSRDDNKSIETSTALKYENTYGFHFMCNDNLIMKFNVFEIPRTYLLNRETGEILFLSEGNAKIETIEDVLGKLYVEKN